MPLRIGFDMDGVLADMEGELAHQAETLFGDAPARQRREGAAAASEGSDSDASDAAAPPPAETDPAMDSAPPLVKLRLTPRQQRRLWRHVATIENFWVGLKEL